MSRMEAMRELSRPVAQVLYDALPDGIDEIRHVVTMFATYSQSMVLLFRGVEEIGSLQTVANLHDHVTALREGMYSLDGGTWFSAVFRVFDDGRMKSSFNFDEEPVVLDIEGQPTQIMPALFAQDFEAFPRSAESTPEWLAAKVAAGRAQVAQIEAADRARRAEG